MKRSMTVWISGVALLGGSALAQAKSGDPCDFVSSGATAFSHEQVTRCYRQVPFDPAALANIVQVVEQHRSFSDLAEIYDARVHWRQSLAALEHDYPSDLAMHDALKHEHQQFRNGHVAYVLPACYWTMLAAFVPFDFGSTVQGSAAEQIVFIESAPLASLYQEATGIDVTSLVGQRVVSINGVPVLDYFRQYTEGLKVHEDAGGGLNGVLSHQPAGVRGLRVREGAGGGGCDGGSGPRVAVHGSRAQCQHERKSQRLLSTSGERGRAARARRALGRVPEFP